MAINIILAILIIFRLLIGLRLAIIGRKNKLPNLIWLSVSMFVTAVVLLFTATSGNPLGDLPFSLWIFAGGSLLGEATLIIFNQLTFYKDRKSPVAWIWTVFIICATLTAYGVSISSSNYNQASLVVVYIPIAAFIWAWHGWLAYQALQKVSSEQSVHDWVKTRYRLIITYSVVLIFGSIASTIRFLFVTGTEVSMLGNLLGVVVLLGQIMSVTLLFLVWAMPEAFRLWLNRNYQKRKDEQVSEQALAIMDMLGTSMSQGTKLPKTLALVSLRKTIGREISTEDSKKIEAHVIGLGYDEWSQFLNKPELRTFLKEVANVNPNSVLENAKRTLVENQSLFTIQAK